MIAELTSTARSATRTRAARIDKALRFFAARWPECGLALAMFAAIVVSGCKSPYYWIGPDGLSRIASDPPESRPAAERINVHPEE